MGVVTSSDLNGDPRRRPVIAEPEQTATSPYRHLPVLQATATETASAYCPWCRFHDTASSYCGFIKTAEPRPWGVPTAMRETYFERNRDGSCADYRPSLWTRLLLALGIRKPKMFA